MNFSVIKRVSICSSSHRGDQHQFTVLEPRLTVGQLLVRHGHALEIDFRGHVVIDDRQRVVDADYAVRGILHGLGRQPRFVDVLSGHVLQLRNVSPVCGEKKTESY